jgi:hypothetical protein
MKVYFEVDVLGDELTIAATANDVNEYSEAFDLRLKVVLPNGTHVPLYKYIDDPEEIERITQCAIRRIVPK